MKKSLLLFFILFIASCSGTTTTPADSTTGDTATEQDSQDVKDRQPTVVEGNFRLVLERRQTLDQQKASLEMIDPKIPEWQTQNLIDKTTDSGEAHLQESDLTINGKPKVIIAGEGGVNKNIDCRQGCYVDESLSWLGVIEDGEGGRTRLSFGRLEKDLTFVSLLVESNVTSLGFYGQKLLVSKMDPECEYDQGLDRACWYIMELELGGNELELKQLFRFPARNHVGLTGYTGGFSASPDGKVIVLLDPKGEFLNLWVFKDGKLSPLGSPICGSRLDSYGHCSSEPGRFTGREPLVVADDKAVMATVENDKALTFFTYDLNSKDLSAEPFRAIISEVSGDDTFFREAACYNAHSAPWTEVFKTMWITGDEVVFTAKRKCGKLQKTSTQILAVGLDALVAGGNQTAALRNITNFPTGDIPANVDIADGGLAIKDDYVVFIGTPVLNSDGIPLLDNDQGQQFNDIETFVTRLDGSTDPVQVSADIKTRTWALTVVQGAN